MTLNVKRCTGNKNVLATAEPSDRHTNRGRPWRFDIPVCGCMKRGAQAVAIAAKAGTPSKGIEAAKQYNHSPIRGDRRYEETAEKR